MATLRTIRRIVVHHSASPRSVSVETIDKWHRQRGFQQIGYHHVIENGGVVKPGRPESMSGAHAAGHNRDSIGVCVVGDNTAPGNRWTVEQWAALQTLLRDLIVRYPDAKIFGHRDLPGSATVCPGLDIRYELRMRAFPSGPLTV